MADNVHVTPGVGASIATDDVGGVQFQKVKLDFGGDGVSLPVTAHTSNPPATAPALASRSVPLMVHACGFADVGSGLITPDLTQIGTTGAGMTIAQSAGNLTIATGTTTNSEFLARSVWSAEGAHAFRWGMVASQRIANQNLYIMLADLVGTGLAYTIISSTQVDVTLPAHGYTTKHVGRGMFLGAISGAAGVPGRYNIASITDADTVRFTVSGWPASGTGTLCLFGWNCHYALYNGTTATNATYDAQRSGWASGATTATINTSATPGHIGHLQSDCSDAAFADSLRASSTGYQFSTRGTRIENLPDQDVTLYAFIWAFNGSTAPASTTTWTINFLRLEDLANYKVYIAGYTRGGAGNSAPVSIIGTPTVTANIGTGSLAAGTNAIGDVGVQYRASSTGGATPVSIMSPATPTVTAVKASAGRIVGFFLNNSSAATRSLKVWNTASGSVTLGTTAALFELDLAVGQNFMEFPGGIAMGTAITIAITGAKGLTDNTAITLNDVTGVFLYA